MLATKVDKATWTANEEIDDLASALVYAYEELHLLYELGASLTSELTVAAAADLILSRILVTVPAEWAEFRAAGSDIPVHVRRGQTSEHAVKAGLGSDRHIGTSLRSGGEVIGSIDLIRPADAAAFSSNERKLLDAVGTLAATAIRNTRLYEELRLRAEAMEHQALHDALTSLPNRTLLLDRLEQGALVEARRHGGMAVLLMDLDRFKEVNDTFGHDYGDRLLQQIGPRLRAALDGPSRNGRAAVRDTDTVARLGGDEFAVLLPEAGDVLQVCDIAQRILTSLQKPFMVNGQSLEIGASIGIAMFPDHGSDAQTLMRRADIAMYNAKRSHDGYSVFAFAEDSDAASRLALTGQLRHGLEKGELELHYQPKVFFTAGDRLHVEALVRWRHPRLGLLPPDRFIPLAENSGLIRPLSHWVLREALRQCRMWRNANLDISVAVNLSMRNLQDSHLPDEVSDLLSEFDLSPDSLNVEITESIIMADPVRTLAIVTRLSEIGVPLSIDDFGTGYSSLGYLKHFPVDELKIDKSFVMNMVNDDSDETIVRSTIDLAHNLGLRVVAEGVENKDTMDRLGGFGCDAAQGFYLGHPVPAGMLQRASLSLVPAGA